MCVSLLSSKREGKNICTLSNEQILKRHAVKVIGHGGTDAFIEKAKEWAELTIPQSNSMFIYTGASERGTNLNRIYDELGVVNL